MSMTLKELRDIIAKEVGSRKDGRPPHLSLLSIALITIKDQYGEDEQKKAERDFGLNKLGVKL